MMSFDEFLVYLSMAGVKTGASGNGDVTGPASSTLGEVATYADTSGKKIGNSGVTFLEGVLTAIGITLAGFAGPLYADSMGNFASLTPVANSAYVIDGSGNSILSQTLPNAVQLNITQLGQLSTNVAIKGAVVAGSALSVHGDIWANGNVNFVSGGTVAITGLLGATGAIQFTTMNAGLLLGDITGNLTSGVLSGDVTSAANSFVTTIGVNKITYPKFQQVAALSIVGNSTNALANAADITASANQILASGVSSLAWSSSLPNAVQLNITSVGTLIAGAIPGSLITGGLVSSITGTANQITASASTGAVTLSLPSSISTSFYSAVGAGGGNFQAFTSSNSTTATTLANSGYAIRNSNSTTNNWMTFAFLNPAGNIASMIGCQMTDQTGSTASDLVLYGRSLGGGTTEGLRVVGATNLISLANPLAATSGGNGFASYSVGNMLYADTTTTLAKIVPAASSILATNGSSIPSFSQTLPNAVQDNITRLGTVAAGIWNATVIDGTYINYNTTNLKVTASKLNTAQDISTASNVSFARAILSNSSSFVLESSSNNSSTSATTNATTNTNALFINTDTTNNNWMTLSFAKNDGTLSAILGCQMVSQTTGQSDFVCMPGNSSGTATEGLRVLGAGYTKVRPTSSTSNYGLDVLSSGTLASNKVARFGVSGSTNGFTIEQDASSIMNYLFAAGNLGLGGSSFGSGTGVIFIANASVNPSTNPSGGGVLYSDAGAGKWRGSSGTVTTIGPANPHCPGCGTDFVHEWQNDTYGYLVRCMNCAANGINSFSRVQGEWDIQHAA